MAGYSRNVKEKKSLQIEIIFLTFFDLYMPLKYRIYLSMWSNSISIYKN